MTGLLLAASWLLAHPASAQTPSIDRERAGIRKDSGAAFDALVWVDGLPLGPENASKLLDGVDRGVRKAARAVKTADALVADLKGDSKEILGLTESAWDPAPSRLRRDVQSTRDGIASEQQLVEQSAMRLAAAQNAAGDNAKRKTMLLEAQGAVNEARSQLSDADSHVSELNEIVDRLEPSAGVARSLGQEMQNALDLLHTYDSDLEAQATVAKAAINALGGEPKEVYQARATQAIAPLPDRAAALRTAVETIFNRSDDAWRLIGDSRQDKARFDALMKQIADARAQAKQALATADDRLAQSANP